MAAGRVQHLHGDFAGLIAVWDVRSGNASTTSRATRASLCLDWHRDGFHVASVRRPHGPGVDLRRRCEGTVLPAHSSLIADVRWAPASGEALVTAGFDGKCRSGATATGRC